MENKKKVLIVVDMQNDFIDGALGTKEAQAIVDNVAKKVAEAKKNDDVVVFTQDTHTEDYLNTQEGKNLPVPHCIKGTDGWEITSKIDIPKECLMYEKGSFGSGELGKDLSDSEGEISAIEFVGLCTDICVLSNAVIAKAALPEVPITVDAACCAGVTPKSHDEALGALQMIQVKVANQEQEPWRA